MKAWQVLMSLNPLIRASDSWLFHFSLAQTMGGGASEMLSTPWLGSWSYCEMRVQDFPGQFLLGLAHEQVAGNCNGLWNECGILTPQERWDSWHNFSASGHGLFLYLEQNKFSVTQDYVVSTYILYHSHIFLSVWSRNTSHISPLPQFSLI